MIRKWWGCLSGGPGKDKLEYALGLLESGQQGTGTDRREGSGGKQGERMVDESLRVRTENLGWGWEEEPEGTEDAEVVCVCVCVAVWGA